MKTCLLITAAVLASVASAAQETVSRLDYTAPEKWGRSVNAGSQVISWIAPEKNASVTFTASREFAGVAEAWQLQLWSEILETMKPAGPLQSGKQGSFLTRTGVLNQPDGSKRWLCLYTLVQNGRGEGVVFLAADEKSFFAHFATVTGMIDHSTVAPMSRDLSSRATSSSVASPPTTNQPTSMNGTLTLKDYEFIAPDQWQVQTKPDHILLTQGPDMAGCVIQILSPQPSSGDLEKDAKAVFQMMYPGWQYQKTGERQYVLSKGILPKGLEYCMMEAPMSGTSADGRYHLEEGAALVVKAGSQVALVAARHRSVLAHNDCQRKYETWRRFFNSFTVKNAPISGNQGGDVAQRIVGVWSQTESGASSEYIFAANGHYALTGALGTKSTSSDFRYEYLHIRTYAFAGDGSYAVSGGMVRLKKHGEQKPEELPFRFEQANHGGTGWKDRLYLLRTDRVGKSEVCYERRNR